MHSDPITHNRVARLAADTTPADFACLVTFDRASAMASIDAVSGAGTPMYRQIWSSARRTDPEWESSAAIAIASSEVLQKLTEEQLPVFGNVEEFLSEIVSSTLFESTFSKFKNNWCLGAPIFIDGVVEAAVIFVGADRFTQQHEDSCLTFAEQSQRSLTRLFEEQRITSEIEQLNERLIQAQADDPLGLTQRRGTDIRAERTFDDIRLSLNTRRVLRNNRDLKLTKREFDLMNTFLQSPGTALSRIQIASRVWDDNNGVSSNVLSVTIKNLREKLEAKNEPRVIHAVRGFGYVLRTE